MLLVLGVVIALAVPRYRAMLKEAVPRYRAMLREQASSARTALRVLRQPTNVSMLLGGNLAAQFLLAIILGLCLKAFGYSATLAQLILVNTIVSLFAGFMPVPGGMGVAEAGYTAGSRLSACPAPRPCPRPSRSGWSRSTCRRSGARSRCAGYAGTSSCDRDGTIRFRSCGFIRSGGCRGPTPPL